MHYNASYGCGKCLKQAFISSLALHNHKRVCPGLTSKKSARASDCKPSSGGGNRSHGDNSSHGDDSSHGGSSKATPKKMARLPLPIPRARVPPCLSAITMLQWTGDLPPPQVPQEGLGQEEKEGKRCEPGPEKCQTPSTQGRWPLLARHPLPMSPGLRFFSIQDCCTAHVSVITW